MMKKILPLLLLFLLLPVALLAQQTFSVADFYLDPRDQSATNPATMRTDQNGETCAIIKVETTLKDFRFDVGSLGITHVDQDQVGEVWVYVPHGVLRISIFHQQLGTIRDYPFPVPIQAAHTYVMKLNTSGFQSPSAPAAVRQQFVKFSVNPPNAIVVLDGEVLQLSDGLGTRMMPFGTYDYRVKADCYQDFVGRVTVNDPVNTVAVDVTMQRSCGWIDVEGSSAQGGTVYIDNKEVGTVPYHSQPLANGRHEVMVVKNLYSAFSQFVDVLPGEHTRLSPQLAANFARLTLTVDDNAEIWVNGDKKGTGSCTLQLPAGSYQVETRLSSHRPAVQSLSVTPDMMGQTVALTPPTPIYGTLIVNSTPLDASITIDGRDCGTTPRQFPQMLVGSHTVTLSKSGYSTETRSVTVREGQTAEVSATLANGCPVTIRCAEPGARIFVDGTDRGPAPFSGTLSFGSHTAYAMAGTRRSAEQTLTCPQGVTTPVSLDLRFSSDFTVTVGSVSFKMVHVAAGSFTMGATSEQQDPNDGEKPAHRVTLTNGYYMGETEVTQALWREVMGSEPTYLGGWISEYGRGDNYPAYRVSYDDCLVFIRRLNQKTGRHFRLPTEAEWEYAARGGSRSRGYQYAGSDNVDDVAWYKDNSGSKTHPVKTKRPNELGLYDMSGNVWEWCQDAERSYSSASQTNPTGPNSASNRVIRGGGWHGGARYCRVAYRTCNTPGYRYDPIGLRLALSE